MLSDSPRSFPIGARASSIKNLPPPPPHRFAPRSHRVWSALRTSLPVPREWRVRPVRRLKSSLGGSGDFWQLPWYADHSSQAARTRRTCQSRRTAPVTAGNPTKPPSPLRGHSRPRLANREGVVVAPSDTQCFRKRPVVAHLMSFSVSKSAILLTKSLSKTNSVSKLGVLLTKSLSNTRSVSKTADLLTEFLPNNQSN